MGSCCQLSCTKQEISKVDCILHNQVDSSKNCLDWPDPLWLITVVYSGTQCVRQAFPFVIWLQSPRRAREGHLYLHFLHLVDCPLLPVTFQQCCVIGCGLHILVYFYSMFTSCLVELESHVCSHCHLQAPSGVDAIKWTDLVSQWVYWCLLAELQSTAVWEHDEVDLFGINFWLYLVISNYFFAFWLIILYLIVFIIGKFHGSLATNICKNIQLI